MFAVIGILLFVGLGAWAQPSSAACAGCHRAIFQSYQQTGMGRSFHATVPADMVESSYYHAPSDSWFSMLVRGGEYFQKRWQLDPAGKQINIMEKRVDYVMGSGNHARTYLHRTPADTLMQLPLGWYSEKGGFWAMNPGYDRPDHEGFRRPISYDCMFCHNAYPQVPAKAVESVYPEALPHGIDCGRCHGDGAKHMQLARGNTTQQQIRAAIVNPKRLPSDRQMELCMSCHLETTSFPLPNALQRYDRGPFSYRPGEPLGDFILNFDHPREAKREDKFEIVNAAYRLRQSACFLKSKTAMQCTACHNPHAAPRGEDAVRHFDAACRSCHSSVVKHDAAQTNCAECHMPKRRTEDVIHAVATDHKIQRHKPAGDLLAERAEIRDNYMGPVALYYPPSLPPAAENELYLAVAQVKQKSNLAAGIVQLTHAIGKHAPRRAEWYLELAEALENNGQLAKALPWYREAVRRDPASAVMVQKLGTALRRSGAYAEASTTLRRAAGIAPQRALTWHELGLAYRALNRREDAIAAMRRALQADPELPEVHNNLGILQLSEASFREAIRIKPDYADAHGNLANLLSTVPERLEEAARSFLRALQLKPADAAIRYNYAMLLGRTGRYDQAQKELEACLRFDASFANAHELLGDMLQARNEWKEAIHHYREALRLRPGSETTNLNLGLVLLASGDRAGALPHLQKASASSDAEIRKRAAQALQMR